MSTIDSINEPTGNGETQGVARSGVIPVVGLGASAGGLDAYKRFFSAMPSNSGMAFVLVQHLDPTHSSMTAQLLAKHTLMIVTQVDQTTVVQANHVYVIPPNKDLQLLNGCLVLHSLPSRKGPHLPVDLFFRSLAQDQGDLAQGVVLSGTGSDGALGVEAIKSSGGLVLVQSPENAQFDGMPRSAINTELVDWVADVEALPGLLIQYQAQLSGQASSHSTELVPDDQLDLLINAVRTRTKYDFRLYKKGTLLRRISRRMALNQLTDIEDYVHLVQTEEGEAKRLFRDLLISVTNFFRDPEAFAQLQQDVIEPLVAEKNDDEPIRVWVAGCATGEEAYSIAMLILEQLAAAKKSCPVQIFASDIDEQALSVARLGKYPLNIASEVSAARLQQFFSEQEQCYQVKKTLRAAVVFAEHNLISDPPFSRLDLISCRNLLIYLEPELQRKIIPLFHLLLKERRFLFLGSSETIGSHTSLFQALRKKARLFQRVGVPRRSSVALPYASGLERFGRARLDTPETYLEPLNFGKLTQQLLLERYAPFAVLVNQQYEVLYLAGQSGLYLEMTTGVPSKDLMAMVREGLRSKVRSTLQKVSQSGEELSVSGRVKRDGHYHPVTLSVIAVTAYRSATSLLLITFAEPVQSDETTGLIGGELDASNESLLNELESELREAKEDLRHNLTSMEDSNEALRASNEEVLSMNEELQSTNEELETSKEELQSLNEELSTVNNQLQDKVLELAGANDDLANLLSNTDIAALFLDRDFTIKRFTPATRKLFNLIGSDIGRPIGDISHRIKDLSLVDDSQLVLESLTTIEREVTTNNDKYFIQHIKPFRTEANQIDGIVATFVDITHLKKSQENLLSSKRRVELLLQSTGEAIYGVDTQGRCIFANDRMIEQLGFSSDELIDRDIHKLVYHTQEDGSNFQWQDSFVYRCLTTGKGYQGGHDIAWRKDGTSFPTLYTVEPIRENGVVTGAMVTFRDRTEERAASNRLDHLARHDTLTGLVNRREFEDRLTRVLDSARHDKTEHVLCYLDLDQFKVVNDTCGHLAGDEFLRQIAGMLESHIRKRDTLARLGGDEFGLLMEHCDLHEGRRVGNSLRDAVAEFRFVWEGKTHTVGVSIGVVCIVDDVGDMTDVLKAADAACYVAKEGGRNRIHVYHANDAELATRQGEMQWVAHINRALYEDRFQLALQPIIALDEPRLTAPSYEVLLRMKGVDGEIIMPELFLGAAERYNLATKLDTWVVQTIFAWIASHRTEFATVRLFNINLSGRSLGDNDFLATLLALFEEHQIPGDKICFEITETSVISNLFSANRFMHALKQLGCVFALDDFGTGLSSFQYLKTLPVEYLKIDGMFIRDILDDPIDLAMVKSINEIGQVMGKKIIAEYVESELVLEKLKELGLNYAQGFYLGAAVPLHEIIFDASLAQPKS
ncbi:EAL domain-containing protein [Reinekea sp.]|uniref:EAL domain-containing protein n=1 Tax=Reinekea sp. TaxID=1970455 RepID=UPI002A805843|nr:EAL domain-containing protein [Reinekea sp.]